MFCMHCGKPYPDGSAYCMNCGSAVNIAPVKIEKEVSLPEPENVHVQPSLPSEAAPRPVPQPPVPAPAYPRQTSQKGSLKVPLIILTILSAIGLVLYLLFPLGGDASAGRDQSLSDRIDRDMPWFINMYGYLDFLESSYTGGSQLTVPETVNGETVKSIAEYCFYDCDSLTTVILPDTLKTIEFNAFSDCDRLRGIYIPEGVTYIGDEAFAYCTAMEAISLPASLEEIEGTAFDGCTSLKYIFFSGTVEQWNSVYRGQSGLKAIVTCSDGRCPLR